MFFRNKYVRFLFQLLQRTATTPLFVLGWLIPKSKRIWIFGNTFGYKDNPKYLYEYLLGDPKIRPIWISKAPLKRAPGGEWYYYLSLKGLYFQCRAGVACIATGAGDLAWFTLSGKFVVQLWHGIPIKKLLLDSPETSPIPKKFKLLTQIFYWCFKRNMQKYDMLAAVNDHNRDCLSRAFGLDKSRVMITGLPRHDIILQSARAKTTHGYKILYAPTWRPSIKDAEASIRNVLTKTSLEYFEKNHIELDVSLHPLNAELASLVHSFKGGALYQGDDINEDLCSYNLLITDFSSIALDFSILGRPVIFMCENLDKYDSYRGVYRYFLDILRNEHVKTTGELLEKISQIRNSERGNTPLLYPTKTDGRARERIVKAIQRKI